MLTRMQLTALVGIAALIWTLVLLVQGQPVTVALANPFSLVVSVLVGVLWAFDKYLWKWGPLRQLFGGPAFIGGTWEGSLRPDRVDPATGQRALAKTVQLVVTQHFSAVHLRLRTDEGESITLLARECAEADEAKQLVGIYLYTPKYGNRGGGKNEIHHGGVLLRLHGTPVERLSGHFFTDKQPPTSGELILDKKIK